MLRAFIIGIVQGITEFLPISSSAHLSIVPKLLGYEQPHLSFEILLHFGTLTAVVAYFHKDLWAFLLCLVAPGRLGPVETRQRRRMLMLLAIGSVPIAIFGFLLQDWANDQTSQALRSSVLLVLTTVLMIGAELYARSRPAQVAEGQHGAAAGAPLSTDPGGAAGPGTGGRDVWAVPPQEGAGQGSAAAGAWGPDGLAGGEAEPAEGRDPGVAQRPVGLRARQEETVALAGTTRMERLHGRSAPDPAEAAAQQASESGAARELERLPWTKALGIGIAQACALIPGVSRSGATISTGLLLGVSREAAARMSFLLSIPAILGAGVLKLDELGQGAESAPELIVGFLASAISGFVAISWLLKLLRTRTLWPFIWYRLTVGPLFVLLLLIKE